MKNIKTVSRIKPEINFKIIYMITTFHIMGPVLLRIMSNKSSGCICCQLWAQTSEKAEQRWLKSFFPVPVTSEISDLRNF